MQALATCGTACSNEYKEPIANARLARAQVAIAHHGCVACHAIPGIPNPGSHVGPLLESVGRRVYLAGVLANTPENMRRWLRDPQQVDPLSAMPNLHIREEDVRNIAAYLSTLNDNGAR